MKQMKLVLLALLPMVCLVSLPSAAFAGCNKASNYVNYNGLSGWANRIANANNADVRTAYANSTCLITAGEHSGGTQPPGAASTNHVTVVLKKTATIKKQTCHIFKKAPSYTGTYFPATCQ
ncbi:hypothetical protein HED22_00270 [Thalassospira sp. HF15]|uniref:hypothetical protein n=1 Tax=Thalassospira sp. HF15 TaxID=2722755 RepID=UPI0014314B6A|nr:hypothetical protein [Thalassospira sp. HF15]NIY74071.1 hypothetical protein [Thalassospira sp. HF15]